MTEPPASAYVHLPRGDPAPWFHQRATGNPNYAFDTTAGRYIVLCFFASSGDARGRAALQAMQAHRNLFDDVFACFFGVTIDPRDESEERVRQSLPGIRHLHDFDMKVSRLYGCVPKDAEPGTAIRARQFWIVLDPTLRVLATFGLDEAGNRDVFAFLKGLPPPARYAGFEVFAPVLVLPDVFEPEFCARLIRLHESEGGRETGFMREVDGKTVHILDPGHKRRRDYTIEDAALIRQTQERIIRRVTPEILKVHCFKVTRMERYIVSCYAAEDGGHFRAHRDNTTKGTAHRRYAVSINLNGDFDGGELGFPEYGPRGYKAPPGGAIVFSGALLHAVSPVTRGRRYAFLPFLYDEEAARIREDNAKFIEGEASRYKAGLVAER
ncbi:2OG-Fe(II) oxygenase [Labrys wisconsinensis]|uniref:2-oxoglutarate/Fe(II)-dependent dioxygenase YbiX/peroxiredoxin n=1 Tax=Labrys wisconsinensis TaxID=425677 RepID=A0ABU0J4J7_9HYPH|nr:2OG-Fe(II) oxygenase [Labrys wisconsinensis]MDQ0469188.1 putative 2-oxoglutarate/Fe(II)-dependent dioxygenase YbiX/peroxiredoxin [Labrys wisconsinensis]